MGPSDAIGRRRRRLIAVVIGSWFAVQGIGWASPAAATTRPHVVLVTLDALRADHVGAYGYARDTTPNLDALAARGVVFEHAMANGGWTLPSIGSMLTGHRPAVHRVDGRRFSLPAALVDLPRALAAHGYRAPGFFDWYVEHGFGFERVAERERMPYAGDPDRKTDRALAWLDAHPGEPSFLWIHYVAAHLPYEPGRAARRRFASDAGAGSRVEASKALGVELARGERTLTAADRARIRDLYDASVWELDRAFGRLVDGLRARDLLDRTVLVVTADHGDELGERGQVGHAWWTQRGTLHEEILHVPLVVVAPGLEPRRVSTLVEQVDLYPTVLELAGVARPDAPVPTEGRTLVPLLGHGDGALPARPAFAESTPGGFYAQPAVMGDVRLRAVREGTWKLVVEQGLVGTRYALFDLAADPAERVDRSEDEPERVATLLARLERWLIESRRAAFALRRDELERESLPGLEAALADPRWVQPGGATR